MSGEPAHGKLYERIEKSQEAIARFARMTEEYRKMRASVPAGPARLRIDDLIRLNEATAAILKRTLVITEGDLSRAEREKAGK